MARSHAVSQRILERLLAPRLAARLLAHCKETGDAAGDVIADAVALHLDEPDDEAAPATYDAIAEPQAVPANDVLDQATLDGIVMASLGAAP